MIRLVWELARFSFFRRRYQAVSKVATLCPVSSEISLVVKLSLKNAQRRCSPGERLGNRLSSLS
jgi:hypothetical protein